MATFTKDTTTNFVPAKGFFNISAVSKSGTKLQLGGIAHNDKTSAKALALLSQLVEAGEYALTIEVTYNDLNNTPAEVTLEDF